MYYETVLLENFTVDFAVLQLSSILSKSDIRTVNTVISSLMGSIYAVLAISLKQFNYLPVKITVSLLMCLIAKPAKKFRQFIKLLTAFYTSNFILGGIVLSAKECFGLSYKIVILSLGFASALSVFLIKNKETAFIPYTLEIEINGITHRLSCMYDSGNMLTDINGNGVIVADSKAFENVITDREYRCRTVNGECLLYGFKPDSARLYKGHDSYVVDAEIALTELKEFGADALIPSHIKLTEI